jgi:Rgg/GadR/MutR family transcriptional activator
MNNKPNKNHEHTQILGQCFKDLRIAKGFSQAEAVGENLSISQLSNFERGVSALTTTAFLEALQNINVTTVEIQNIYNNRLTLEKDNLLFNEKISSAYLERNTIKLKNIISNINTILEKHPDKKKYKLDKIKIEAIVFLLNPSYKIPKKDINFVKQYLTDLKEWGEYDILLFGSCVAIFDVATLSILATHMINPTHYNSDLHFLKHKIIQTLNNLISIFTEQNQFSLSQKFINYLENNGIHEYYMYDKTTLEYNKAMLSYKQGNKSSIEMMRKCQEIFEFSGCYNTAQMISQEIANLE